MRTNGYWRHCALAIAVAVVTSLGLLTALSGVTRTAPTSVPIVVGVTSAPIAASQLASDAFSPYKPNKHVGLECAGNSTSAFVDGPSVYIANSTSLQAEVNFNRLGQPSSLNLEVQAGFNESVTGLLIMGRNGNSYHSYPLRQFVAESNRWSTVIDIAGASDKLAEGLMHYRPWMVLACTAPAA